jgi:predicted  nucleic acid-binding Zn-ribbon protein
VVDNPFLSFVDFVESDRLYDGLVQKKTTVINELQSLRDLINQEEEKVNRLRKQVHALKKSVDAEDLEVRALRSQEREKQIKLALVTVPKEYLSLQHELELLSQKIEKCEDQLLAHWQELEDKQHLLQQAVEESAHEQKRIGVAVVEKEQLLAQVQMSMEEVSHQKKLKEEHMVPEWRETYAAMKERVPNPAVFVIEGACSACFYPVSAKDLALLRRHVIVQCKDCYRLLYSV